MAASSFSVTVAAGTGAAVSVQITDLLEQYGSSTTDTLPTLYKSSPAAVNGVQVVAGLQPQTGTVATGHTVNLITVSATATQNPEPASITVLAAGLAALGVARRRRLAARTA